MSRRLAALAALALLAVAGSVVTAVVLTGSDSHETATHRGSTLPERYVLPSFSPRDQNGTIVSDRALRGRVVVLTFLDTECEEACPVIAGMLGAALPRLTAPERQQVRALAVTVNPAADTPSAVKRFLRVHRATGTLDFLLGSIGELRPLWREFKILSAYETGDADIHSAPVRIYDRDGTWVSTLHAGADLTAENLIHDVRRALEQ